jgi:hypothetical protein
MSDGEFKLAQLDIVLEPDEAWINSGRGGGVRYVRSRQLPRFWNTMEAE